MRILGAFPMILVCWRIDCGSIVFVNKYGIEVLVKRSNLIIQNYPTYYRWLAFLALIIDYNDTPQLF